jgi:hypothetical protein
MHWEPQTRLKKHFIGAVRIALSLMLFVLSEPCFASFESSLGGLKTKLTVVILPILSVMGLAIAAISLLTGNPQAKQHILYAILGCVFGFGAQSIVEMIASTMR